MPPPAPPAPRRAVGVWACGLFKAAASSLLFSRVGVWACGCCCFVSSRVSCFSHQLIHVVTEHATTKGTNTLDTRSANCCTGACQSQQKIQKRSTARPKTRHTARHMQCECA